MSVLKPFAYVWHPDLFVVTVILKMKRKLCENGGRKKKREREWAGKVV